MHDDLFKDFYGIEDEGSWYSVIPLAFLVSIVPLIVYGKVINFTGDYFKYWNGVSQGYDFFSYYKVVWILIATVAAIIVFAAKWFSKRVEINKIKLYIPMAIYSLLVILSALFSKFSQIPIWGYPERYEGMVVILSYMVILFLTINLVNNKASIKAVLIALIASALIIGTIGIMQYFGHDFYKTLTGRKLILPASLQSMASTLKFQFGPKIIYASLYHYNYVGSYMAILFPLTFTMFLLIKNKIYKVLMAVVTILMFLNLVLCHSRAGIVGGAIAMVVLIIMMREFFIKNWKGTIGVVFIAAIAIGGFNAYSKGALLGRIGTLFKDAQDLAKGTAAETDTLKNITIKNDTVNIIYPNETLKIKNLQNNIVFEDTSGKQLRTNVNGATGKVTFMNNNYKQFQVTESDNSTTTDRKYSIQITKGIVKMQFLLDNGKFYYVNYKGDVVDIKPVAKWGFKGEERLGSARGYIWSRSIPLLKNTMVLGYGPDTFGAVFPQTDYIGKLVAYDTDDMLVDKAHDLYLENAINIGIPGLIAFLAILTMYIVSCSKLYFKREFNDFYSIVGLAIFTSIIGYLGAGFFNDSVVSVAPVFWVLLGIGVGINYKLKNSSGNKDEVKN
jgi:O-antigen ligase